MEPIAIHSYRTVFDIERRIYRIDRVRLNPAGVPLRGVLYCAMLFTCAVVLAHAPLAGELVRLVPWYMRDLLAPLGGSGLLVLVRVEGRPAHLAVWALVRYARGPHHTVGLGGDRRIQVRWCPPALVVLPDGSDGRLRRLHCKGPGVVRVAPAHERAERELGVLARLTHRPQLVIHELADHHAPRQPQPIWLTSRTSLRVR